MRHYQPTIRKKLAALGSQIAYGFAAILSALVLAGCTSQGTGKQSTGQSRSSAFDILVGSCYTHNVLRFDGKTGKYLGEFVRAGAGGLNCPEGEMIFGDDGFLYVSSFSFPVLRHPWEPLLPPPENTKDKQPVFQSTPEAITYNDQVLRFDGKTGEFVDVFIPPSAILNGPHGLAFTREGNAFVATRFSSSLLLHDSKNNRVKQILIENQKYKLSNRIDSQLVFRDLNSISVGPDGKVYVASYQTGDIFQFDRETGDLLRRFVNAHESHWMKHPHNVLFGPDKNLYVTNISEDKQHSILRFDGRTGNFMDVFVDGKDPKIEYPSDIAFAPDRSLLVVDCSAGAVFRYDGVTGKFLNTLVPPNSGLPSGATSIVVIPK